MFVSTYTIMKKYTLFIIRAPSGCGKSTLAKQFMDSGLCKYWVETDKFFYVDGVYKFDASKLGTNHNKAFNYFCQCVDMNDGNIVQSNTNISRKWFSNYVEYANKKGFNVTEIILNQQFQNVHGVPQEKVDQMKQNFEY